MVEALIVTGLFLAVGGGLYLADGPYRGRRREENFFLGLLWALLMVAPFWFVVVAILRMV